jgi:hypothetical protein
VLVGGKKLFDAEKNDDYVISEQCVCFAARSQAIMIEMMCFCLL